MSKNIFIPFDKYSFIGGPATFMCNLKKHMDVCGWAYTDNIEEAESIFFPIEYSIYELKRFRNTKGAIIQRLDGVYYEEKHGSRHGKLNRNIKKIYEKYADLVVFQSEYSKKQCFKVLGVKEEARCRVILNGVDKEIFYPEPSRVINENDVQFITTGNFRDTSMLEPIIRSLDGLCGRFSFKLNIVGPIADKSLKGLIDRDYVVYHKDKDLSVVACLLREADIFLYSHVNPPCPNSVLEAISCGLPVVSFDSGAMRELCGFSADLLAGVNDKIIQSYDDFDHGKFMSKIEYLLQNYISYRKMALDHADLYDFRICGEKYLELFGGEND